MGKQLTDVLCCLAQWLQETDRLPGGEQEEPLDLDTADWTLVAAMMAPDKSWVVESLSENLDLSRSETLDWLNQVRDNAVTLAVAKRPRLTRTLVLWGL